MSNIRKLNGGETEIDLLELLLVLKKRFFLIILITLLSGALGYARSVYLLTPKYESFFTAYVNNRSFNMDVTYIDVSSSDVVASRYIANTYSQIITSRRVLLKAAENAGLKFSAEELSAMVRVTVGSDTEILKVSVTTPDPQLSKQLAENIMNASLISTSEIVEGSSMCIIDEPFLPVSQCYPNNIRNAVIGAMLGFVCSCAVIVLIGFFDDKVKDEQSLEQKFNIPVIGTIPSYSTAVKSDKSYYGYGRANAREAE